MRMKAYFDMLLHLIDDSLSFFFNQSNLFFLTLLILPTLEFSFYLLHRAGGHILEFLLDLLGHVLIVGGNLRHLVELLLFFHHSPQIPEIGQKYYKQSDNLKLSFLRGLLLLISICFVLRVVHLFSLASTQLETTMRTDLLYCLKKLELNCILRNLTHLLHGLTKLISSSRILVLFLGIFLQLIQRFTSILYLLRVCSQSLNNVLNESIGFFVLSTVFVRALHWKHRPFRLCRIFTDHKLIFFRGVCWFLFVQRKRMRQVNWSGVT